MLTVATRKAVEAFARAINHHDMGRLTDLLTEDSIFESPAPAPDGRRYEGRDAVLAFWEDWFAEHPDARFDAEEVIVADDRAVVRWVYRKVKEGKAWHLRGVDVFKVVDGRIAEKLSYVKG